MTTLMPSLHAQVLQHVASCYQQAESKLGKTFSRPIIEFTLTGKSAGSAHLQQNRLRFNATLLTENTKNFLDTVVPHEVCHLLCFQLFGKVKPHGTQWRTLMIQVFNLPPKATHSFDVTSVTPPGVEYRCACGTIMLSARRHNKVQRGVSQYVCKQCRTQLRRNIS